MSAQLASYALGFVASILIARALGPEGRGIYYLPVVAATSCMVIFSLSVETANTILFAEGRQPLAKLSRNATALAVLLGRQGWQ